jgi:hypothetical protein
MTNDTNLVLGDQGVSMIPKRTLMPLAIITETPQKSVRRIFHELNGTVSKFSVHRMLNFDLRLILYKTLNFVEFSSNW